MSAKENGISPETQDWATPSAGIDAEMPNQLDLGNLSTTMMDTNTSLADDAINFVSDPGHFPDISTQSHITEHHDASTLGLIEDTEATQRQSFQGASSDSSDCASTPPRSGWDTAPEVPLAGRKLGSRGTATRSRPIRPPQSSNSSMNAVDYSTVTASHSSSHNHLSIPSPNQYLELFADDFGQSLQADIFRYPAAPQQVHHHHHHHHQQESSVLRQFEQQAEAQSMKTQPRPAARGRGSFA
ncbi:transcription factor [Colletotrichum asianum]|uniref:Transcription factor n=1 Tax=Colletotrichum asianum TaxID=702518 RepID=A0A8H3WV82_9PEZI|nr:transcription factor [Colletotrichum asianum]